MNNDLISRKALKKWIDESVRLYGNQYSTDMLNMFGLFREIIDNAPTVEQKYYERIIAQINPVIAERPQGEWIVTAEDNEGIHRIQCPFCGYEKGTDFIDYITVTFEKMPPFCENCGAELKGGAE